MKWGNRWRKRQRGRFCWAQERRWRAWAVAIDGKFRDGPGPAYPPFDSFVSAKGNVLNDASLLEPTEIRKLVQFNARIEGAFIHQLRDMIRGGARRPIR